MATQYTEEDYKRAHGANWKAVMQAELENEANKKLSRSFQKAMAPYAPGGSFGKGVEAGLVRGKTQSMASGMNALIGSGLAGTTMAAGLGKKYEEEVAAPIRAGVESTRAQNLSALNVSLAQTQQGASQFNRSMTQNTNQFNASQAMQKYMADLQAGGQAGQLGLGYAQLNAQNRATAATPTAAPTMAAPSNNNFRVPKLAPNLFKPATLSFPKAAPITKPNEAAYQGGWTG